LNMNQIIKLKFKKVNKIIAIKIRSEIQLYK
jgi:hypothetical protein